MCDYRLIQMSSLKSYSLLQNNVKKAKAVEDDYMSDEDDIDKEPFDEIKVSFVDCFYDCAHCFN